MEQSVWFFFAVLSVILAFGTVAVLVDQHKDQVKEQRFEQSLSLLKTQCEFVCESEQGTKLAVDVELVSGLQLKANYANTRQMCVEYKDQSRCALCPCVLKPTVIDLNNAVANASYATHMFSCSFERLITGDIAIDCQG